MNFARIFARISLVFLLKMRPYFARIFTKMSPYEELVTLRGATFYAEPKEDEQMIEYPWAPPPTID